MGDVPTSVARVNRPDECASSLSDLKALWRTWRFLRQRLERAAEGERRRSAAPIDPSKPVVFLSYRTAEHTEVARTLHLALEEAGFRVWFDEDHGTLPSQVLYLDVFLEEAMRAADVLVLLQPRAALERQLEREESQLREQVWALLVRVWMMLAVVGSWTGRADGSPPAWYAELEGLDDDAQAAWFFEHAKSSMSMLRRSVPPPLRAMWLMSVYGFNPIKRLNESWQMWERRMARFHGLEIVTAGVQSDVDDGNPVDVIPNPLAIRDDAREFLAPRLAGLRRRSGRAPLTPELQRLWARRRRYALVAAAAVAFTALLAAFGLVLLVGWALRHA
jgi:hypothetical protein